MTPKQGQIANNASQATGQHLANTFHSFILFRMVISG